MRRTLLAIAVLGGCYFEARPGVTAPIGHGHGGAGFDLGFAVGGEYANAQRRVGAGINVGPRLANDNGYTPVAVEAHAVIPLVGETFGSMHRLLLTTHAAAGFAIGLTDFGPGMQPRSPDGAVAEVFVGLGLGATETRPVVEVTAGHVALGLSVKRFWPESAGSFWMIGAALEVSYSFQNGGQWAR